MSGPSSTKNFRMRRSSVPPARRHVRSLLVAWRLWPLADAAELIVSELATNATRHARGMGDYFVLTVSCRDSVLALEVTDSFRWRMPELAHPQPDEQSGRGLLIVDQLAARWGVLERNPGKTVWAELPLCAQAEGAQ